MNNKELVICTVCKGIGKTYWQELTDYHKGEYDTHEESCKKCNGTGKCYKITKIEYIPFE